MSFSKISELAFLKDFNKQIENIEGITTSNKPPRFWVSTGNHCLNKILSGSFYKGIPQGRLSCLAGPSHAGKSFLAGNIIKQAQKEGMVNVVIDTENALDEAFLTSIGVDPNNNLHYYGVSTISHATKIISTFIKGYKSEYGNSLDAPRILITLDSLDMLMLDQELDNYDKGKMSYDQGLQAKQLKQMLRPITNDIKNVNVCIVTTKQVYKNQDMFSVEGKWNVNDAIRYAHSIITVITRLKLKNEDKKSEVLGIRMLCEGFKTRFTKPYQNVIIDVPYDTGINLYSGMKEVAVGLGVIKQSGGWYKIDGEDKFLRPDELYDHMDVIVKRCEELTNAFVSIDETEDHVEDITEPVKPKRKSKKEDGVQ